MHEKIVTSNERGPLELNQEHGTRRVGALDRALQPIADELRGGELTAGKRYA